MATVCDSCGNRTNEVKSGGGIESKGVCIEVDVKIKEDLCRDLLKVSYAYQVKFRLKKQNQFFSPKRVNYVYLSWILR